MEMRCGGQQRCLLLGSAPRGIRSRRAPARALGAGGPRLRPVFVLRGVRDPAMASSRPRSPVARRLTRHPAITKVRETKSMDGQEPASDWTS